MQTAKVLDFEEAKERRLLPQLRNRIQGDGRAIAVAKFRELADKLESGELDGARVQWRDDNGPETEMVVVTISRPGERNGARVAEDRGGVVQLTTTTIEEV